MSSLTYDAAPKESGVLRTGQPLQVTSGNGAVTTLTYEATTLRLATPVSSRGRTSLQDLRYTYDHVRNHPGLSNSRTPANTQTFGYHALNRLTPKRGRNCPSEHPPCRARPYCTSRRS